MSRGDRCWSAVPTSAPDRRRDPDERRVADSTSPRIAKNDDARERGDPDRAQRRRRGDTLREAGEEDEQRHRDDPPADAEERGEHPGHDADGDEAHRHIVRR